MDIHGQKTDFIKAYRVAEFVTLTRDSAPVPDTLTAIKPDSFTPGPAIELSN